MLPLLVCIIRGINLIKGSLKIFINIYPNKKSTVKTEIAEIKILKNLLLN
jgi:hypothetical protein